MSVGSGSIVDGKRGLIVTAAHVLFNYDTTKGPFGAKHGRCAVVGLIPDQGGSSAVFRYFAEVAVEDVCNVDACVLRIVSRMPKDVDQTETFATIQQPERLLDHVMMQREGLRSLKMAKKLCALQERVVIMGYNQCGENILEEGKHVSHAVELAPGFVCKHFEAAIRDDSSVTTSSGCTAETAASTIASAGFSPRKEIVLNFCYTFGGQSGGPAVNSKNEVVGILSRTDANDPYRSYLVPVSEYWPLVLKAKEVYDSSMIQTN